MQTFLLGPEGFTPAAGIPLTDLGFRYGMSVFETVAIRNGAPLLLDSHLLKLAAAVNVYNFHPPLHWPDAARALLVRPPIDEGVARLYVTAGDDWKSGSRVAALLEPLPIPTDLGTAAGVTMDFTPAMPFGKTGNYWPNFLARQAAGEAEAILCRPDGLLLGGSTSNLFLLLDDTLATPRLAYRHGAVRDWILHAHSSVQQSDLTRDDLARATAAFLTNSRLGLRALTAIDTHLLDLHPHIEELWSRYRREVLRAG